MKEDRVFAGGDFEKGSFRFNESVALAFDNMADRSIPFYREVMRLTAELIHDYVGRDARIYDLGCATGSTLLNLALMDKEQNFDLIGYDPAESMLEQARKKASAFTCGRNIRFLPGRCEDASLDGASAIICNYTLQFIAPKERAAILQRIYDALPEGGVFLISEKVGYEDEKEASVTHEIYMNFKRRNGYSELEIANKRDALEDVLIPWTFEENLKSLKQAGFKHVDPFFKWCNFASFIAIK